jgi:hypothetical protein
MISAGDFRTSLACSAALFAAAALAASYAGNESGAGNSAAPSPAAAQSTMSGKKSMSHVVKACADRQAKSLQSMSDLIAKLAAASATNDPAQMKAAIEDAHKTLTHLKSEHVKCHDALVQVHGRLEKLRMQIKTAHNEHEKASNLVEDEDMDEIIWAE